MRSTAIVAVAVSLVGVVLGTTYFVEEFGDGWEQRWVESTAKGSDQGKFKLTAGKFYGDAEKDKGIQTSQDAKFYGVSAKFDSFSNEGKTLVIQFTVKHEQSIDCGGGYVKLYPSTVDQKGLHGDSPYHIMFGPDICGYSTKKVHVIFTYKEKNHLVKKEIRCKDDVFTHLYTLIVRPDNTYEVLIDNEKAESGSLESDWDILPPKKIKDPSASKPEDWDEREKIDDPSDSKPDDWEKPEHIPDASAKKPDDWDDEMDGEWEPPQIPNPEYKGEWKPRQIDNPAYKGKWVHPEIDNPEYTADANLYRYTDIGAIGFDLWQVKSGTIFDNVIITDSVEEAKEHAKLWSETKDGEKKMKDKQDEEDRKREEEERKKKEEEEKKKEDEDEDDDDEDEKQDKVADDAKKSDDSDHDHDHDHDDHDEL